ncbi:AMP-dependent synthetase/ligase [Niabella hirudinis]|uniref:AMP-dependent synthetase/ligase n=1 Tax=Niabella hirudinis TaxID=1285929 RepID=UPI003EBDBBC6
MSFPAYRLFDAIAHQLQHFPKPDMLNAKTDGAWKSFSTEEVGHTVNQLSLGLIGRGISGSDQSAEASDKIAIISQNRPEWVFTDLAVQQTGAILIPIYPTTNPNELEFILNESQAKFIFVSNRELLEKVQSIKTEYLQGIYTFDRIEGTPHYSELFMPLTEVSEVQLNAVKATITPRHTATIIYTSGTTGTPKGVMLSHENIVSNVYFSKASFPFEDQPQTKTLSFLPLNHIFEKTITYIYLFSGIGIYYAESMETIADNLREIQPDGFTTVPRLLEKVYEKIMLKGKELKGIKKALFYWSVNLGAQYNNRIDRGAFYNWKLNMARKLVFSKWREALGGHIKFIITGGAAAPERLLRIFNAAGIPVFEGYGPTEHSPVICVNRKEDNYMGTVGPALEGVEVKLAEDGEILAKSVCIMQGYYKRPELTADVIKDGWLCTGDIGEWIDGRYLKITDRKKELFKTSGGKYVAPQPIENKMKESKFIEQIMVVGNDKKFVSALIVPSFHAVKDWMQEQKIEMGSNEEIVKNPKVHDLFRSVIDHHNTQFNHIEQIKKFVLLPREWSVDTGEMTPKLSLKRKVILEKFRKEIDEIYS